MPGSLATAVQPFGGRRTDDTIGGGSTGAPMLEIVGGFSSPVIGSRSFGGGGRSLTEVHTLEPAAARGAGVTGVVAAVRRTPPPARLPTVPQFAESQSVLLLQLVETRG